MTFQKRIIDYQNALNPEQFKVVQHGNGPALVLAGAGSGKTRTVTYRLAYLIEQGIAPDQILLLTFTNKAASEMLTRAQSLLGNDLRGLWTGTFHSVANRLLRLYAPKINFSSHFTILDQDDSKALIKACLQEQKLDIKNKKIPSAAVLQAILSFIRNADQELEVYLDKKYPSYLPFLSVFEEIQERYTARKQASDAMDFDDLLFYLRKIFVENKEIQDQVSNCFQYIMVDEYQDTNHIQADLIRLLSIQHRNLLVVGDDAQSIYSFRAAQIQHILDFPKQFPQAKVYRLTKNYRSSPEILSVANVIIDQNEAQFKKELSAVCQPLVKPNLFYAASAKQEASYVVDHIEQEIRKGKKLSDLCVLFRATFHSQTLEMELLRRHIPYEYRGGLKFFERAHIKDILAYLRVLANPKDEMAWIRILGHQAGIGLVSAQKISHIMTTLTTLEQISSCQFETKIQARAKAGFESVRTIIERLIPVNNPAAGIQTIIDSSYREYLELNYPDASERLEDIERFCVFAKTYDDTHRFLEDVALQHEVSSRWNEKSLSLAHDRVILSTIHQAKGLEWPTVFVIHLSQGSFPHPRAMEEEGGLEEERRLFYVAITRAKEYLFFSVPMMIGYTHEAINGPSMFLQEIPSCLLKTDHTHRGFARETNTNEPIIVLDNEGEYHKHSPKTPGSFLRSIEDL